MKLDEMFLITKKLKMCAAETHYVSLIDNILGNYNDYDAQVLIAYIVDDYMPILQTISANISNRPVLRAENANAYYAAVDDKTVRTDLIYLRRCLIAISAKRMGLIADYAQVAKELNC